MRRRHLQAEKLILARQTERRYCGFPPKLYAVRKWGDVYVAECAGSLYGLLLVRRESAVHINQNTGVGSHSLNPSLLLPELADLRLGIESKIVLLEDQFGALITKGLTQNGWRTTF